MSDDDLMRRIMQDNIVPGLTTEEKVQVRAAQRLIIEALERKNPAPIIAYIALLNVLGSLIGLFLTDERDVRIAEAQQLLPLYVEAYRSREKKL